MLTHDSDRAELVGALHRGAHDYLVKPFDPAELDARVTAALRVKALHDALLDANRRLAAQALTDDLTGLPNRRAGTRELERAVALAVRHGHVLGGRARRRRPLQAHQRHLRPRRQATSARRGRAPARRGPSAAATRVARWGGDEFVAILPDTDRDGRAARRRAAPRLVADAPVEVEGASVAVTVSVGWAHWSGDTPGDLLARADRVRLPGEGRGARHRAPGALAPAASGRG